MNSKLKEVLTEKLGILSSCDWAHWHFPLKEGKTYTEKD
jgi:hypothetical protein